MSLVENTKKKKKVRHDLLIIYKLFETENKGINWFQVQTYIYINWDIKDFHESIINMDFHNWNKSKMYS